MCSVAGWKMKVPARIECSLCIQVQFKENWTSSFLVDPLGEFHFKALCDRTAAF